ncbi:hypothetical protein ABPG74_015859 [Tetrahymena malaccensis]
MSYFSYKSRQQQYAYQQAAWQAYLRMDPMNCIIDPQGSKGGLYLGNIDAAQNVDMLRRHNIGAVLTVAARTGLKYDKSYNITHHIVNADDVESYDLSRHFPTLLDFIEQHIQHTNVLVHCFAGVSRSSTTVIAYLMKTNNWSYEKSLFYCKSRRKVTNPNPGFIRQLMSFERRLQEKQNNLMRQQEQGLGLTQSTLYQDRNPVRVLPQSSHSNRNENVLLYENTSPSQNGKKMLSMTLNSFKPSNNDQNTPNNRGYGTTSSIQADQLSTTKSNFHDQTLQRSSVKQGSYAEQIRSQSQQANRITDSSSHFGGSNKANQADLNSQLSNNLYQSAQKTAYNESKSSIFGNNINYRQNDRSSYKDRSTSSQPIYSQQVHPSGYELGGEQRGYERGSSVRSSNIYQNLQNNSHYQNQQNFASSLRNSYQKAPSYVVSQQTPKTVYGSNYMNFNKTDNRPYQIYNNQLTPQSVYSSSYGVAQKSGGYNPKYYPTRRALFSDRPLF